jgi:hypothetical protein
MPKKPTPPVEVTCPCCQAKLTIDPQLAVVLSREDKFRESWEAEKKKEDVLTRKFEEALKKAKDQPVEKPLRDFDLE